MEKYFTDFLLVVDNEAIASAYDEVEQADVVIRSKSNSGTTGSYQLLGDVLTRFSDHCTNTVTQTSDVPKSEIQVRT